MRSARLSTHPLVSVVVPTYNRADTLRAALESLCSQRRHGIPFELLVVDNNSTDHTVEIARTTAGLYPDVDITYLFEPRQGVSHARNTGIDRACAPIVAFVDDDVTVGEQWLQRLTAAFADHPEADCIGGRISARWTLPRPSWLTEDHLGPLAIKEWPDPFWVSRDAAWPCLQTANFACRRCAFEEIGGFNPDFARGEDRELQLRLWQAGKRGMYVPEVEVLVEIPAERLTRTYHRKWQANTAHYHALMWYRDRVTPGGVLGSPRWRTWCGTPLFLYREGLAHLVAWVHCAISGDADRRFYHETRLWYTASFLWTRLKQWIVGRRRCRVHHVHIARATMPR